MSNKIVLGLGYGDEGKGLTTDYLCRHGQKPLVIRFSGGHQAGHTVVDEEENRHVFSSFGAGTLQGVPTYWSRFCTLYPQGFLKEKSALKALGFDPKIYVDALVMVTTPYDIYYNRSTEQVNLHGSCGVGFGATVERNTTSPNQLYVQDLFYPQVVAQKLKAIEAYYEKRSTFDFKTKEFMQIMDAFFIEIKEIQHHMELVHESIFFAQQVPQLGFQDLIFEGSQGILLDMDHGFFPNMTRANTTSKNAMEIIKRNGLSEPEIYYVTRAYQTRHGNGFLSNEAIELKYKPNPLETNVYNPWQGHQRQSILDVDLLNYAFDCDRNYSGMVKKHLVVTCLDQLEGSLAFSQNEEEYAVKSTADLIPYLSNNFESVLESWSDCSTEIWEVFGDRETSEAELTYDFL